MVYAGDVKIAERGGGWVGRVNFFSVKKVAPKRQKYFLTSNFHPFPTLSNSFRPQVLLTGLRRHGVMAGGARASTRSRSGGRRPAARLCLMGVGAGVVEAR